MSQAYIDLSEQVFAVGVTWVVDPRAKCLSTSRLAQIAHCFAQRGWDVETCQVFGHQMLMSLLMVVRAPHPGTGLAEVVAQVRGSGDVQVGVWPCPDPSFSGRGLDAQAPRQGDYELYGVVQNRPGVLAEVAELLARDEAEIVSSQFTKETSSTVSLRFEIEFSTDVDGKAAAERLATTIDRREDLASWLRVAPIHEVEPT